LNLLETKPAKEYVLKNKRVGRGKNAPTVDFTAILQRICGVDVRKVSAMAGQEACAT
jgi:hypothetical protein